MVDKILIVAPLAFAAALAYLQSFVESKREDRTRLTDISGCAKALA